MFLVQLNNLQGVELICKRLRESGCIASSQLADGIEKTLLVVEPDGRIILANPQSEDKPKWKPIIIEGGSDAVN